MFRLSRILSAMPPGTLGIRTFSPNRHEKTFKLGNQKKFFGMGGKEDNDGTLNVQPFQVEVNYFSHFRAEPTSISEIF